VINVLLNALASSAGGGVTYLKNVLPLISRGIGAHTFLVLVPPQHLSEFLPLSNDRLTIETINSSGTLKRMCWEQANLRSLINSRRVDMLISLGNFAVLGSPVPQILFNRNDLLFSDEFERDLRRRKLFAELATHKLKSWLARQSIKQATVNVTPTRAFAKRIQSTNGLGKIRIETLRFGFDPVKFTSNRKDLPETLIAKLNLSDKCRRVLFVSHYNYFRNFETLIRALPIIKSQLKEQSGNDVQLVLTTDIQRGAVMEATMPPRRLN